MDSEEKPMNERDDSDDSREFLKARCHLGTTLPGAAIALPAQLS
jgi:hypothetical protein